ncbi:LysE family translocator [Rhodovastum atsumiense]|uniref:LysE family translocator n=1 Tax=Rhodovastum atsumiense TaxID=504468 RepID=A0A5M6IW46_9PROT|nr:LysE family transporter [Rhodovastum atsumiense]KAA5611698.1 LysE family translocator [Rhodovastum atsumiense]CAH2604274.1 LysE family translocator [Rhodovastum atsumiense]
MDLLALYLKAAGFGLAVAAPVGPMSVLCMRRSLTQGWQFGLATGLGIAVADAAYAVVAALGLASVSAFLLAYEQPLHLAAGLFLIWLGVKTFLTRDPGTSAEAGGAASVGTAFGSSLLLTLTNPPTIIMFAAIFTALAPRSGFDPLTALWTVAGVFSGSLLWWCGMVAVVSALRHAIGAKARRWIDRVAGVGLIAFGTVEVRRAV